MSTVRPPPLDPASTRYVSSVSGSSTRTPPPLDDACTNVGGSANSSRTPPPLELASTVDECVAVELTLPPLDDRCSGPRAPSTCTPPPDELASMGAFVPVIAIPPPLARTFIGTPGG